MSFLPLLAALTIGAALPAPMLPPGSGGSVELVARAQATPAPTSEAQAETEDADDARYQVYLLTMDQGDEVWERFGHNALLIRDRSTGQDLAWNWGLFDFEDIDFLPRFLRGTMRYSMGPAELNPYLDAYAASNRTIYANEILLTAAEAAELEAFVRWNYLPANRAYTYHYFLDNCSTRLRDALDRVLGGILADTFIDRPTPHSYRWHSRRLVQETGWIDQGLSFLLGMRGDIPRTEWEAMFVPMELMVLLEGVERPDPSGEPRPLLGPREVLFQAMREPAPPEPPAFSFLWIVAGLVGAGAFVVLAGAARRRHRWAAPAIATGTILWGVVSGALGGLLVMAWFTDHDFIHWNLNLLYLNPLSLLAGIAGGIALWRRRAHAKSSHEDARAALHVGSGAHVRVDGMARNHVGGDRPEGAARSATGIAVTVASLSLLAAVVQLTPWIHQGNAEVVALGLPVNLAVAWALVSSLRRE